MENVIPSFPTAHRDDLAAAITSMPCSRFLGLEMIGLGDGRSAIALPVRPDLTFDGRSVQGGIVGTLADYAAVSAATASLPEGWASATTGFQVYNLAPARGERLVGVGRLVSRGRSQAVAAAEVYAYEGDTVTHVATALATCKLLAPAP